MKTVVIEPGSLADQAQRTINDPKIKEGAFREKARMLMTVVDDLFARRAAQLADLDKIDADIADLQAREIAGKRAIEEIDLTLAGLCAAPDKPLPKAKRQRKASAEDPGKNLPAGGNGRPVLKLPDPEKSQP